MVGRRGGKSRIAALVAVYLACFRDYRRVLARGERGHVMVLAADRRQARVVFRYISGLLDGGPDARRPHRAPDGGGHPPDQQGHGRGSYRELRAVRGYTVGAAILDEVAFWPRKTPRTPTSRSSPRSVPRWRPSLARSCSASARPMRDAEPSGKPSAASRAGRRPRPRLAGADPRHEPDHRCRESSPTPTPG